MPVVTVAFGALLTALGVVSYTGAVAYFGRQPYSSVTALIPAFVEGIVLNKPSRTVDLDAMLDAIAIAAACDEAVSTCSPVQIRYQ